MSTLKQSIIDNVNDKLFKVIPEAWYRTNILYTNIGRGHPNYLDGIKEALHKKKVNVVVLDVFKISYLLVMCYCFLVPPPRVVTNKLFHLHIK